MVLADARIDEDASPPEKKRDPMFLKDERDEPAMLTAIRGAAPDHPLLWTTK